MGISQVSGGFMRFRHMVSFSALVAILLLAALLPLFGAEAAEPEYDGVGCSTDVAGIE